MATNHTATATAAEAAAMLRALELATQGPLSGPNPRVGCVLLDSTGTTLAEGFHAGSGTPHAEVVALTNLRTAGFDPADLTAVVSLEPCAHTGKTGPCVDALLEAGIARVVYSVSDPGAHSGGGATKLEDAGVSVVGGVEQDAGTAIVERWLFSTTTQRPWVTLKWAMSLDGRAAAADGTSQWITGPGTREIVHRNRSEHDVIAVGTTTALVDDPSLTARDVAGDLYPEQPMAVVVGNRDIPADAVMRSHPGGFHHHKSHNLDELLDYLFAEGKRSVYVEGGPTLASAFLGAGLVNECHITMGPVILGGPHTALHDLGISTMSDALALEIRDLTRIGDDIVVTARPASKGH
jgi:diaminohydroxyphosphoribosylaminopyrimidine deaminase/5-amino-6-(5-phosphoribosylamino)uracil reductase